MSSDTVDEDDKSFIIIHNNRTLQYLKEFWFLNIDYKFGRFYNRVIMPGEEEDNTNSLSI